MLVLTWQADWDDSDPPGSSDGRDDMLENLRRNFISTLNQAGDQVSSPPPAPPHPLAYAMNYACGYLLLVVIF